MAILTLLGSAIGLLALALFGAVWLGGPQAPPPHGTLHTAFASVDVRTLPAPRHTLARDGTALAWRHYAPAMAPAGEHRRAVLVHGSAGHSASMHTLAQALAQAGFTVAALDLRGHGGSGVRGQIDYLGQLEDDLEDFLRAQPHAGPQVLLGFSSGGGFALRVAAGRLGPQFERHVLLAPFLHQDAPTAKPGAAAWVGVGLPRLLALGVLNRLGITRWNTLPVLAFAVDAQARAQLAPTYALALATNFRPHEDWRADIRRAAGRVRVVVGQDDALFDAQAYGPLFAPAPVTLVPGTDHADLILKAAGVQAAVQACLE